MPRPWAAHREGPCLQTPLARISRGVTSQALKSSAFVQFRLQEEINTSQITQLRGLWQGLAEMHLLLPLLPQLKRSEQELTSHTPNDESVNPGSDWDWHRVNARILGEDNLVSEGSVP